MKNNFLNNKGNSKYHSKEYAMFGLFLLFSFILVPYISSVPPITSEFTGNTGLDVEANFQDYYKVNEGAEVHIYVFNITTGDLVNTSEVDCSIELTDRNGTVKLEGSATPDGDHYHMTRPASVVTEIGVYAITVVCNGTNIAGYKTAYFEATDSGIGGVNNVWLLVILTILSYGLIIGGFKMRNFVMSFAGSGLLLGLSIYIFVNGFGSFAQTSLIPQLFASANFMVGAYFILMGIWRELF